MDINSFLVFFFKIASHEENSRIEEEKQSIETITNNQIKTAFSIKMNFDAKTSNMKKITQKFTTKKFYHRACCKL